jgi:hypothetical protein
MGAELQVGLMPAQGRTCCRHVTQAFREDIEAIVIPADEVDRRLRVSCSELAEPIERRFHGLLLIAKMAPAEIEGIAIQDDDIGRRQIVTDRRQPLLPG